MRAGRAQRADRVVRPRAARPRDHRRAGPAARGEPASTLRARQPARHRCARRRPISPASISTRFLAGLKPAPSIHARHTVGLLDALDQGRDAAGKRLDDGLPESLEEVIAAYGHRYFKLKVAGKLDADIERLARIAAVLDRRRRLSRRRSTATSSIDDADAVHGAVAAHRRGAAPRAPEDHRSLFIEQPIARARALQRAASASSAARCRSRSTNPTATIDVFPRARALGYRGISAKSCKGFYRALLNRGARAQRWNAEEAARRYFMSAEDLTTQARRRGAAGPGAGDAGRRHACRAQRPSLRRRHGRRAAERAGRVPRRASADLYRARRTAARGSLSATARYRLTRSRKRPALAVGAMPDLSRDDSRSPARSEPMRTEGLSINLATVRQQWNLREAVGGLRAARHSRRSIPGATRSPPIGLDEAVRVIKDNGMRVTGYCRGGMFPAADAAGRAGGDRRQQARDRRGRGARRRLPGAGRRRPAAGSRDIARRAADGGRRHRRDPAACARAATCRSPSSRCIRCMPPTAPA